jgi:hypothetical protein
MLITFPNHRLRPMLYFGILRHMKEDTEVNCSQCILPNYPAILDDNKLELIRGLFNFITFHEALHYRHAHEHETGMETGIEAVTMDSTCLKAAFCCCDSKKCIGTLRKSGTYPRRPACEYDFLTLQNGIACAFSLSQASCLPHFAQI